MVRTGNVDFSCKRLTSIEIRKSKYHIIRRVRFRWDPPLRKISGSALATILSSDKLSIYITYTVHYLNYEKANTTIKITQTQITL